FAACNTDTAEDGGKRQGAAIDYIVERNYDVADNGVAWFKLQLINPDNRNHSSLTYQKTNEEYASSLDYYLNQASADLLLDVCGRQLHPVAYHFENNYNLVGYDVINVGFDVEHISETCE